MRVDKVIRKFNDSIVPVTESGCWIWMGNTNGRGYGILSFKGKLIPAHRFSWIIKNGAIPSGINVLHHCDTPACVNPTHLFLGTQKENIHDCIKKGRFKLPETIGEKNSQSKLTEDQVLAIRKDNRSQRAIAKDYCVSQKLIWLVKHNVAWSHVREIQSAVGIPCRAA